MAGSGTGLATEKIMRVTHNERVVDIDTLDPNLRYNIVHPDPLKRGLGDMMATSLPLGRTLKQVKSYLQERVEKDRALDAANAPDNRRGLRWATNQGELRPEVVIQEYEKLYDPNWRAN